MKQQPQSTKGREAVIGPQAARCKNNSEIALCGFGAMQNCLTATPSVTHWVQHCQYHRAVLFSLLEAYQLAEDIQPLNPMCFNLPWISADCNTVFSFCFSGTFPEHQLSVCSLFTEMELHNQPAGPVLPPAAKIPE